MPRRAVVDLRDGRLPDDHEEFAHPTPRDAVSRRRSAPHLTCRGVVCVRAARPPPRSAPPPPRRSRLTRTALDARHRHRLRATSPTRPEPAVQMITRAHGNTAEYRADAAAVLDAGRRAPTTRPPGRCGPWASRWRAATRWSPASLLGPTSRHSRTRCASSAPRGPTPTGLGLLRRRDSLCPRPAVPLRRARPAGAVRLVCDRRTTPTRRVQRLQVSVVPRPLKPQSLAAKLLCRTRRPPLRPCRRE